METLSVPLALCEENPPVTGGFQSPTTINTELLCPLCCQPQKVVEQTIELLAVGDTMKLMWCHCDIEWIITTFKHCLSYNVQNSGIFQNVMDEFISRTLASVRAHLQLHCQSIRAPDSVLFTLHPRLRSVVMATLVTCSSDYVNRQLWACALHNLGRTWTSVPEKIATCSDKLGHRCPRQKSRTQTQISVNTKHKFTGFF